MALEITWISSFQSSRGEEGLHSFPLVPDGLDLDEVDAVGNGVVVGRNARETLDISFHARTCFFRCEAAELLQQCLGIAAGKISKMVDEGLDLLAAVESRSSAVPQCSAA
jgi:hypothetical protein